MESEIFHSVTFWLVAGVMAAAFAARAIHFFSVGSGLAAPFFESAKRDQIAQRTLDARARFRNASEPTFEDDLNDALRSPAPLPLEEEPDLYPPGMERMPETWPPEQEDEC